MLSLSEKTLIERRASIGKFPKVYGNVCVVNASDASLVKNNKFLSSMLVSMVIVKSGLKL